MNEQNEVYVFLNTLREKYWEKKPTWIFPSNKSLIWVRDNIETSLKESFLFVAEMSFLKPHFFFLVDTSAVSVKTGFS